MIHEQFAEYHAGAGVLVWQAAALWTATFVCRNHCYIQATAQEELQTHAWGKPIEKIKGKNIKNEPF